MNKGRPMAVVMSDTSTGARTNPPDSVSQHRRYWRCHILSTITEADAAMPSK